MGKLKIYSQSMGGGYYASVPTILLKGKWLEEAGFHKREYVGVEINGDKAASEDLGDVQYLSSKTAYESVAPGTHYYKGVARLWLEGEDKSRTNDLFRAAANQRKSNPGFRLGDLGSSASDEEAKTNIDINVSVKAGK